MGSPPLSLHSVTGAAAAPGNWRNRYEFELTPARRYAPSKIVYRTNIYCGASVFAFCFVTDCGLALADWRVPPLISLA